MLTLFACLALGAAIAAEEPSLPATSAPPLPVRINAAGGMSVGLLPDTDNVARGGVRLDYEAVRFACDHLAFRQSRPGKDQPAVLERADFFAAEDPASFVAFDSTASQLPSLAYRGVLNARSIAVRRLPADSARPRLVRFRAVLEQVGDFAGDLQVEGRWRQHLGWAQRMELVLVADVVESGSSHLGRPRMSELHTYGLDGAGDDRRPAVVLAPKDRQAAPDTARLLAAARAAPVDGPVSYGLAGMHLVLKFDDDGRLIELQTGDDGVVIGTPPSKVGAGK